MSAAAVTAVVTSAATPGAVAMLQLHGSGAVEVLRSLTGERAWPAGRLRLRGFADIDEGLAVALREDWVQLMPHGGPRVVQELLDYLRALGVEYEPSPDARTLYPEAGSAIEADVLAALAAAASPAAVDLLAAQPAVWRGAKRAAAGVGGLDDFLKKVIQSPEAWRSRSAALDRLVEPPTVVVVGRPNVGKSTLTNAMLGRAVSIVADLPGTTRDWVAGLAELVPPAGPGRAVAVRWIDTPGLRATSDAVEREAIELARQVLSSADVLIAMRDRDLGWPDLNGLPKPPDLFVLNKIDDAEPHSGDGGDAAHPLAVSAATDRGLEVLASRVIEALGLLDLDPPPLWPFSPTLRAWARGEPVDLAAYVAA